MGADNQDIDSGRRDVDGHCPHGLGPVDHQQRIMALADLAKSGEVAFEAVVELHMTDRDDTGPVVNQPLQSIRGQAALVEGPAENGGDKLVHGSGGISQPRAA